jgi:hypothetical protein
MKILVVGEGHTQSHSIIGASPIARAAGKLAAIGAGLAAGAGSARRRFTAVSAPINA